MRELEISCELSADPKTTRSYVMQPALFLHVAAPLITFSHMGARPFAQTWQEGEYHCRMRLLGFVPIGWQVIVIAFPEADQDDFILRDKGYSSVLKTWDHRIKLAEASSGGTLYTDSLQFDAGLLTPMMAIGISQFFRHRQRRLRALDKSGFEPLRR